MATPPLPLDGLARFAATADAHEGIARLALHVADTVIARQAGASTAEGQALRRFVLGTDAGLGARVAADAATIRLTEIDDIHRPTAVTVSAITVPVAVAFAHDATAPARFFEALHAGQELALRLGAALGGARLLTRGLWPSLMVAPFGAAATAGRLLGLPAERMRHALALALAQVARPPGRFRGARPGRWWLFGEAVRSGCMAALAASDGIDGDPDLLSEAWLHAVGGDLAEPAALMPGESLGSGLSIKPHASAKQVLAAIHGLRELMTRHGIGAADIAAITLQVPPAYAAMLDREPPHSSRLASLVHAPWQLALAAWRPDLLDDVDRTAWPADPRLADLAGRIRVVADPALDARYPETFPARLLLHTAGRCHELLVTDSPGDPALPFDAQQLLDKARRVLGNDARTDSLRTVLDLHKQPGAMRALRAGFGYAAAERAASRNPTHPS